MSTKEEKSEDVEAPLLHPSMEENPALRWAFIRKVYAILAVQFLAMVAVAAAVAANPPLAVFFRTSWAGWAIYALIILFYLYSLFLLIKHPRSFLLLGMFTLSLGLGIGLPVSFVSAVTMLEPAIAVVVVILTLIVYTFWAARGTRGGGGGEEFGFLKPFMWTLPVTIILFSMYQIYFPMEETSYMVCNGVLAVLFSVYIIYYTNFMMKRNSYDQYIWASITFYTYFPYHLIDKFVQTVESST